MTLHDKTLHGMKHMTYAQDVSDHLTIPSYIALQHFVCILNRRIQSMKALASGTHPTESCISIRLAVALCSAG
jgi:hypothetical protein